MAAIMATMKRIPLYRDLQNEQQWKGFANVTDGFLGGESGASRGQYRVLAEDLSGKTVLIVGYGSIGEAIEARRDAVWRNGAAGRAQLSRDAQSQRGLRSPLAPSAGRRRDRDCSPDGGDARG